MTPSPNSLQERLLDAHVAFMLDELTGPGFAALVEEEVKASLGEAVRLTLNDVVTRDMIKETAKVYAVDLELHGAMPELVGDIARAIYSHAMHDQTHIEEVLPETAFREMLDKAIDMKALRQRLIHESVTSPLYSALLSDVLYHGILGYLKHNPLTRHLPGAKAALKLGRSVLGMTGVEASLEDGLKQYIHTNIRASLQESERFLQQRISDERIENTALDIWEQLHQRKVGMFRQYISSRDVEDFFVIAYEYWRELRQSPYYSTLIDIGVDAFFDKYGDTPLPDLLTEVGLNTDMLVREAMRFAPPILTVLKERGMLEPLLRRRLQRFYQSGVLADILADATGSAASTT